MILYVGKAVHMPTKETAQSPPFRPPLVDESSSSLLCAGDKQPEGRQTEIEWKLLNRCRSRQRKRTRTAGREGRLSNGTKTRERPPMCEADLYGEAGTPPNDERVGLKTCVCLKLVVCRRTALSRPSPGASIALRSPWPGRAKLAVVETTPEKN